MEQKIITAVGISVNSKEGEAANRRIEAVVQAEIRCCLDAGLDPSNAVDSAIIRQRMAVVHDREVELIREGR